MKSQVLLTVASMIAGAGLTGLVKNNSDDVQKARAFQLVDSRGIVRGEFGLDAQDAPALIFRNSENKECARWTFSKGRSVLQSNTIFLVDENGDARMELLAAKGTSELTLADAHNRPRVHFETANGPRIFLLDENANDRIELAVDDSGPAPGADIFISDGKRKQLQIWSGTTTGLGLWDKQGRMRVELEVDATGPHLSGSDPNGKPLFRVPESP